MTAAEIVPAEQRLLIVDTGEVVDPLTREEASSLSTRISVKLDAIADNYTSVMPMIQEAITRRAHLALGYKSPGAYVADRFGKALSRLGSDLRRQVVGELTAAGLSTRAIAPVLRVDQKTVVNDQAKLRAAATTSEEDSSLVDDNERPLTQAECEALDNEADQLDTAPQGDTLSSKSITGVNGKTYSRSPAAAKSRRKPLADEFRGAVLQLGKDVKRINKLGADDRLKSNADQIRQGYLHDLIRARDALQCVIDQLSD